MKRGWIRVSLATMLLAVGLSAGAVEDMATWAKRMPITFSGYTPPSGGSLDEARFMNVAVPANWVWASWLNAASNGVFNTYGLPELGNPGAPHVATWAATNVTTTSAYFNGTLSSTGTSATAAFVYWGETDGGTNAAQWANTNMFAAPLGVGPLTTNVSLQAGKERIEVGPTSYSLYPMDTNDRPSLSLTKIPPPSISYSARSHFRFAARPIRSLRLSALECLTSFACLPATMTSADFCPLPTRIAPRRAVLHASVRDRIANRSPRIRTLTLTGQRLIYPDTLTTGHRRVVPADPVSWPFL